MTSRMYNLMNDDILKNIAEEVGLLCNQKKYKEAYVKCELAYIQFSDYIEWYHDNNWYKGGTWNGKQKEGIIYKSTFPFVELEGDNTKEPENTFEGIKIRKRSIKKPQLQQKQQENEVDVSVKMPLLLMDWFSVASYHTGNMHRSYYISYKLLQTEFCDNPIQLNRVKNNTAHCIPKIKNRLQFYPEDIIAEFDKILFEGRISVYIEFSDQINLVINSLLNAVKDITFLKLPFIIITEQSKVEVEDFNYKFVKFVHLDDLRYSYPHLFIQKNTSFFCRRNYIKTPMNILIENGNIDVIMFNQIEQQNKDDDKEFLIKDVIQEYRITRNNKKFLLKKELPKFKTTGLYKRSFETIVNSASLISNHYTICY